MSQAGETDDITPVDFEQSMAKLDDLVNALESGELSLEASLKAFEDGIRLTKTCQEQLNQAKQRVTLLVGDGDELKLEDYKNNDE